MKDLIERSYNATRKRGKITADTDFYEFVEKMEEELAEIHESYRHKKFVHAIKETVELMAVCMNSLYHHGFDPIAEFEKCVIHQETRKD